MSRPAGWRLRRATGTAVLVVGLGWGAVAPAGAHGREVVSDVTVAVHHDGHDRARAGLRVARTMGSAVSAVNRAYASARCDDCRAVALSFQVVLANRAPTDIAADNAAVAVNEGCARCETVAVAYQFVVARPGRSQLTPAGHVRLAGVRRDLMQLARSGASPETITTAAAALAAEVTDVLTTELRTLPRVEHEVRTDR